MGMESDERPFNCDKFMEKSFLQLKEKYGVKNIIETGTYHGITTEFFAKNFECVHSIEISEIYLNVAKERLDKYKNTKLYHGSSERLLGLILKECDENTIVFLDAHWYKNPLLGEIEIISNSGIKPILIIHDFKNPMQPDYGYDIYPDQNIVYDWNYVKDGIEKIYGNQYNKCYNNEATGAKRGCLFIIPKL